MKSQLTSMFCSALIASTLMSGVLLSTRPATAQGGTPLAEVNIPFAFQTSMQSLPAGTYQINRESNHVLMLMGPGKAAGFVLMNAASKTQAPTRSSIVFDHYGNKYFLRQIWTKGDNQGLECPKGRVEKEILQVRTDQVPSSVELALNSTSKK
jgi:hypothetical protein